MLIRFILTSFLSVGKKYGLNMNEVGFLVPGLTFVMHEIDYWNLTQNSGEKVYSFKSRTESANLKLIELQVPKVFVRYLAKY